MSISDPGGRENDGSEKQLSTKDGAANRRRRTGPPPGTKPSDTAGGDFERRIARVEFGEGALVRLRVPVPADTKDSGRDILTDIDILSIDVDNRLRVSTSSHECKSGKGQSGEPYTMVWLAGFRQLLALDRVSIARQTISSRGHALARQLGIVAMDERTLRHREDAHSTLPLRFAHIDGLECVEAEERTDKQLRGLPEIPLSLTRFLRGHGMLAESPALLSAVSELRYSCERQGVLPEPAAQVLAGHSLIAVVLAGIRDAGRLDQLGERELYGRLERALTLGDENDVYLLPLLERADAFVQWAQDRTHRAYTAQGAERLQIDFMSLRDAVARPPEYLDGYMDFVIRMRSNPLVAQQLLQSVELLCFDALLGGISWRAPAFEFLFTPEHRGLILVALRCVRSIAGSQIYESLRRIQDLPYPAGRVADSDVHVNVHSNRETTSGEVGVQGEFPVE